MPRFLAYILGRVAMSFTVIRTWKKDQVRGEFMRSVSVLILMISCVEQKALLEWLK